ncbi:MAG: 2-amino-4-hydroxy-6-hydroxymethyldihydropteridine diphosphokinase [Parashewanella sp.]
MAKAFIALGANLNNPQQQLDSAVRAMKSLASISHVTVSPYYASTPMGEIKQPDYVNAVASIETELSPIELLDTLQSIELMHGRERTERWGPRTLDLDILLYDNLQLTSPRLTIPHYGMKHRGFVLFPLSDIASDLVLPCGTLLADLVNESLDEGLHRLDTDR